MTEEGYVTLREKAGGILARKMGKNGEPYQVFALDISGREMDLYTERQSPKVPCPGCRSTNTRHLQDKRLECSSCQLVTGYPVDIPNPGIFCPSCGDGLLPGGGGFSGPNRQRTVECGVCRVKFRQQDNLPRNIVIIMA